MRRDHDAVRHDGHGRRWMNILSRGGVAAGAAATLAVSGVLLAPSTPAGDEGAAARRAALGDAERHAGSHRTPHAQPPLVALRHGTSGQHAVPSTPGAGAQRLTAVPGTVAAGPGDVSPSAPTASTASSPVNPSLPAGSSGTAASAPAPAPPPPPAPAPPPAWSGAFSAAYFAPSFAGRAFCAFAQQNARVTGGVLTVTYAAGSSAPSAGAPYGGAQLCVPRAAGPATDVTLDYDIRFPVGFQWVKGGKLPGLYGGVEPFSGGSHNANGWSMRLMWRAGGAAEVYGYISTTSGYGDSWGRGNFFFAADGRWHHLTEHVHLNSPGASNGWVTLAYDGVVRITRSGLAITTTATPVSGLFFSTFYGGHDSTWSPSTQQHIDFRGFRSS